MLNFVDIFVVVVAALELELEQAAESRQGEDAPPAVRAAAHDGEARGRPGRGGECHQAAPEAAVGGTICLVLVLCASYHNIICTKIELKVMWIMYTKYIDR